MLNNYIKALGTVFFPHLCFHCETKIRDGVLCGECLDKIEYIKPPFCIKCARALKSLISICVACRKKQTFYERLISIASYKAPLSNLIHLFKYKHCTFLKDFFAQLINECLKERGIESSFDHITAVPSHRQRLRERGYNQAYLLAKELANFLEIPLKDDIIICKKSKAPQVTLAKEMRRDNVRGIFQAQGNIRGKRILLVDDIFTTGATVNECSKALKENNARSITVLTLAKAQ